VRIPIVPRLALEELFGRSRCPWWTAHDFPLAFKEPINEQDILTRMRSLIFKGLDRDTPPEHG